ncbi:MAG: DUF447 family protein [Planctomycetales bacterium]|nr:DUF447 family protein [Planctomycetales bacterium]
MILEGLVTTLDSHGNVNISPMGPRFDDGWDRFVLRPYQTSRTYRNLRRHGEGVFHITDDVDMLARAAVGQLVLPSLVHPTEVQGAVIASACRWYEFRVESLDDQDERTTIVCRVVHSGRIRDFIGFNRAKHAVVEAAILATRLDHLPHNEIQSDLERLAIIVSKTAGDQERRAFRFLREYLNARLSLGE